MMKPGWTLFLLLLIPLGAFAQNINDELITAARKSDVAAVKALLAKGANVNAKTEYGATPLFFACDRGNLEIARMLIDGGADVNAVDTFYKSNPLVWAVSRNRAPVVKLLLEKGAKSKEVAMVASIREGHLETVKAVLEIGGFSPELMSDYLALAEKNNQTEIAEELKKAGAKPKPKSEYKIDPEALKIYEGVFKNELMEAIVKVKDGKLVATVIGRDYTLTPTGKHTFEIGDETVKVSFLIEAEKVTAMNIKEPSIERILKKQ